MLGERLRVFSDILDYPEFFLTAGAALTYDEKAFQQRLVTATEAPGLLKKVAELIAVAEPFDAAALDNVVHDFVTAEGIKIGQIVHALRIAVTGKAVGAGLFETLALLGRETCGERIAATLARCS
jgi:glutamyl-tRNA synthetase